MKQLKAYDKVVVKIGNQTNLKGCSVEVGIVIGIHGSAYLVLLSNGLALASTAYANGVEDGVTVSTECEHTLYATMAYEVVGGECVNPWKIPWFVYADLVGQTSVIASGITDDEVAIKLADETGAALVEHVSQVTPEFVDAFEDEILSSTAHAVEMYSTEYLMSMTNAAFITLCETSIDITRDEWPLITEILNSRNLDPIDLHKLAYLALNKSLARSAADMPTALAMWNQQQLKPGAVIPVYVE